MRPAPRDFTEGTTPGSESLLRIGCEEIKRKTEIITDKGVSHSAYIKTQEVIIPCLLI